MAKKKLKTTATSYFRNLSLRDSQTVQHDLEFLAHKEISYDSSERPKLRRILAGGDSNLYKITYLVVDYFSIEGGKILGATNYTHAQVRDMRSTAKRKSK